MFRVAPFPPCDSGEAEGACVLCAVSMPSLPDPEPKTSGYDEFPVAGLDETFTGVPLSEPAGSALGLAPGAEGTGKSSGVPCL